MPTSSPHDRRPDDGSSAPGDRPDAVPAPPPAGGGSKLWLLPALTFLAGVLLGGSVMAARGSGDGASSAGPTTSRHVSSTPSTPSAPGTPRPDATITVPGACLQLSQQAQSILTEVDKAAAAARDLDASRLGDVVRHLQQSRSSLEKQVAACKGAASPLSPPTSP